MTETSSYSEIPLVLKNPLVVERDGQRRLVIAVTDLDGTANDETAQESERINTISEASKVVRKLELNGIPFGIGTSRSTGEAIMYQNKLGGNGTIFSEDGAAIVLPHESLSKDEEELLQNKFGKSLIKLDNRFVLRLSELSLSRIDGFLSDIDNKVKEIDLHSSLISTRTSTIEELKRIANHATLNAARLSAERIASAYVASPTDLQRKLIEEESPKWGIRAHGDHINLIGRDANKANAMKFIDRNAQLFYPHAKNIQGIIPIFFGNGINDLPLLEQAESMGGVGVLVAHPKGGYFFSEDKIPSSVIKTTKPYGYGMNESLSEVFKRINTRFVTSIS